MLVRHADPERDAAACVGIYAPYVADTAISFEEVAPTAEQFAAHIAATSERYPWLVLEDAGVVVGYTYATQHRARAAYRWAADVGIYVDLADRGKGVGRRLYEGLFGCMRSQHLRVACAGITLPNDASIALHKAVGFEQVGIYRDIGYKRGAWHDVAWLQLALSSEAGPPPEPLAAPWQPGEPV